MKIDELKKLKIFTPDRNKLDYAGVKIADYVSEKKSVND